MIRLSRQLRAEVQAAQSQFLDLLVQSFGCFENGEDISGAKKQLKMNDKV